MRVHIAHFDGPGHVEALAARAIAEAGRTCAGVELSRVEVRLLLAHLGHGQREAAARLVGLRRGRSQRDKT